MISCRGAFLREYSAPINTEIENEWSNIHRFPPRLINLHKFHSENFNFYFLKINLTLIKFNYHIRSVVFVVNVSLIIWIFLCQV